ncbi:MAG TPA: hypothetical protein VEK55_03500 [Xanthobacteraceae bacterium]|nr:hypothetical protein [Xanthobacteraceae bacterium]
MDGTGAGLHASGVLLLIGRQLSEASMRQTSTNEIFQADPIAQPLKDILRYLTEVVRLDGLPMDDRLADDRPFVLHQNDVEGLPGITCNTHDEDGAVWLAVERLTELDPPDPDADLSNWIDVSRDPEQKPRVRDNIVTTVESAEKERLVTAEQARLQDCAPAVTGAEGRSGIWNVRLRLADHADLASRLERFIAGPWASWAEAERPRRRTTAIYQRLLEVVDRIRAAEIERPVELVWGIGICRRAEIAQPLLEQLVEIEVLESQNGEIRIRPRLVGGVELNGLASPPTASRPASEVVSGTLEGGGGEISPFVRGSFEPLLNRIGWQLDPPNPSGVQVDLGGVDDAVNGAPETERRLFEINSKQVVSDRWMILLRPRSNRVVLRDIEGMKDAIDRALWNERAITGAARVLALGPSDNRRGRGHRALPSVIGRPIDVALTPEEDVANHSDLFLPLPFDTDQIEIIRSLEKAEGLAVQTDSCAATIPVIANVICHYLARGQRVLVVSRDTTSLSRLRQSLPLATRDLVVGPTNSDKQRSRQIATAVQRLQSMGENLRSDDQAALIDELERDVAATRRRIDDIDDEVAGIARVNLRRLPGFVDVPSDVTKKLIADPDPYSWFDDRPEQLLSESGLSVAAVDAARDARMRVGNQLSHINEELPAPGELPQPDALARLHADLREVAEVSSRESVEDQLAHRAIAAMGVEGANNLAADLELLCAGFRLLADEPWIAPLSCLGERLGDASVDVALIVDLARDVSFQLSRGAAFLARPVEAPADAFLNRRLVAAVDRLGSRRPISKLFGLGAANLKPVINAITVAGLPPSGPDDWVHVREYLMWRRDIHALNARWMSLAVELGGTAVEGEFPQTILNLQRIETCVEVAVVAPVIAKRDVATMASSKLAMSRAEIAALLVDAQRLHSLGRAIESATTRLEGARRELARLNQLFAGSGVLTASVRNDVLAHLGKDQISADQLCADWIKVREQVASLYASREDFALIGTVSGAIAQAGAPRLAQRMRADPVTATIGDQVLPTDWASAWNWAVLTGQLEGAGQRPRLRMLGDQRQSFEARLRQLFEAIVAARTQLALAQTMTAPIKQALSDFVTTSQQTGLSARDAIAGRNVPPETLEHCYRGIPCWIVPRSQLAEQLPSQQIGAFDLVIIQEASDCDARDLTALLRGRKVLVVGEEGASWTPTSLQTATIEQLEKRFLSSVPKTIRPFLLPGSSLYDLTKLLFPYKLLSVAATRVPARRREPNQVDAAPTTQEQSGRAMSETHAIGGHRPIQSKSLRGEAPPVAGKTADTSTIIATPSDSGAAHREAAATTAIPEWGLGDALRMSTGGRATASASVATSPASPLESAPRRRSLLADAEARSKSPRGPREESVKRSDDPAIDGEKVEEPPAVPARSGRLANAAIRRVDRGIDVDVTARFASHNPVHARMDAAPPRRSINGLAATLGTVSIIAALSMFVALAVAVYGLFGPNTNSDVGSRAQPSPPPTMSASSKISDRIAQSSPQAPASDQVKSSGSEVPVVVQPAVLYEEDPSDPNGKEYSGTVTWQADSTASGPGPGSDVVVRADLQIPQRQMSLAMSFRRNTDQTVSATHVFELRFKAPSDPPHGEISKLQGLALKPAEKVRGTLLAGQTIKVTPGFFLVMLSPVQPDMQRNLKLLKDGSWFDVMFLYSNGNRAILAMEKGTVGERAFTQAFGIWGQ